MLAGGLVLTGLLSGCGSHGYVSSDIPGVAEALGSQAINRNTQRTCPYGAAGYADYTRQTTHSGFLNRRVSYSFYCG